MSKNIKEIGKELMGKSLNSFHRKTGLTQLEKNNEMQDGILNGILSQVDNAYIEKTEQSNVIHLDGSGDGVVVLDSIEGNTVVNLIGTALDDTTYYTKNPNGSIDIIKHNTSLPPFNNDNYHNLNLLKPNTQYTLVVMGEYSKIKILLRDYFIDENGINNSVDIKNMNLTSSKTLFTTNNNRTYMKLLSAKGSSPDDYPIQNIFVMILEGDWTNKEIPTSYIEGLQSSFEEKVNDEDKYEIEILSNSKNLLNIEKMETGITAIAHPSKISVKNNRVELNNDGEYWIRGFYKVKVKPSTKYIFTSIVTKGMVVIYRGSHLSNNFSWDTNYIYSYLNYTKQENRECVMRFTTDSDEEYIYIRFSNEGVQGVSIFESPMVEKSENKTEYNPHKQNKIKLLINEPLRSGVTKKDNLCVIDNKLYIERNTKQLIFDGSRNWIIASGHENICHARLPQSVIGKDIDLTAQNSKIKGFCDKLSLREHGIWNRDIEGIHTNNSPNFDNRALFINIKRATVGGNTSEILKTYLSNNPIKLVIEIYEPVYEEVVNEYGEPIILEGYENGTVYIDSTIVPNTTVRYTPKMESFKTLNEVSNNNTMLTNDVNDNIIPYMMDVDLMIMEKEMALMSHKNIRKMEVLDMTSMQKRTQDMLERLIKGKTLTEQECKTRVTTYLHAGKITDEQAEELMLLIDEVYA